MLLPVAEALKRRRITRAGGSRIFVGKQVKVQVELLYNRGAV